MNENNMISVLLSKKVVILTITAMMIITGSTPRIIAEGESKPVITMLSQSDYTIIIENTTGNQGDLNYTFQINGTWAEEIWIYSIHMTLPPDVIERVAEINLEGCIEDNPFELDWNYDEITGDFRTSIISTFPPVIGEGIPPGEGTLFNVVCDINEYAPRGNHSLDILDDSMYMLMESWEDIKPNKTDGRLEILGENPYTPSHPAGPDDGIEGEEMTFYTNIPEDAQIDTVYLRWDWDDGTVSELLGPYLSGTTAFASYTWSEAGIYHVRVQSQAEDNHTSAWSDPWDVFIWGGPELHPELYTMTIESSLATPGETNHSFRINGTWNEPILGYAVKVTYDAEKIEIVEVNLEGCVGWAWFAATDYPEEGYFIAVWSKPGGWSGPGEEGIAAGNGTLFNVTVDIITDKPAELLLHIQPSTTSTFYFKADQIIVYPLTYDGSIDLPGHPYTPHSPSGPREGDEGQVYSFEMRTPEDPEGDPINLTIDWGDGTPYKTIGPYPSGTFVEASHTWTDGGIYNVQVKAKDIYGGESLWSNPHCITINELRKPTRPSGSDTGEVGIGYTFIVNVPEDIDDLPLYLTWDWGDGTHSEGIGPYYPGETASATHQWDQGGEYQVKVITHDMYGAESDWSEPHPITIKEPYLNLNVKGGFGLTLLVKNLIHVNTTNVKWDVDFEVSDSARVGFIRKSHFEGTLPNQITPGTEYKIKILPKALGRFTITAQVKAPYIHASKLQVNGLIIGPFVVINRF